MCHDGDESDPERPSVLDGLEARAIIDSGGEIVERLGDRIIGRVALDAIADPSSGEVIVDAGIERVRIRSVLTCAARRGVCAGRHRLRCGSSSPRGPGQLGRRSCGAAKAETAATAAAVTGRTGAAA